MRTIFNTRAICSTLAAGALATCLTFASSANAQSCAEPERTNFAGCANVFIDTCEAASATCVSEQVAITLEDVKEEASRKCCAIRNNTKKRLCLANLSRTYRNTLARARSLSIRQLIRNSIATINNLRKSNCGAGNYADFF